MFYVLVDPKTRHYYNSFTSFAEAADERNRLYRTLGLDLMVLTETVWENNEF